MKRSSSRPLVVEKGSDLVQAKRRKQNHGGENSKLSSISELDTIPAEKYGTTSASLAHATQRSPPAPFLPCHLSMLEALHKDDYNDAIPKDLKQEENDDRHQRNNDRSMVWDYIKLFLNRRENLIQSKAKAIRLRGILDEAALVSNNIKEADGVGGGGNGEESIVVPPPSSVSGNINNDDGRIVSLSFITQSQSSTVIVNKNIGTNPNQHALSFTSLTSPSKKKSVKTTEFSPFSFHRSNSQRRSRNRNFRPDHRVSKGDENEDDDGVKSLNLVMKIMKKRCAVADALSEREMKPFLPLVKAVKAKIKELDEALQAHIGVDREEDPWDSVTHEDDSLWNGSQSQFCVADNDESIERIAKIQSKIWLWNLLSDDLLDCMQ